MPEVTVLSEGSNYILESHTLTPPSYPMESVIALGGVALGEPTWVGEVILAGYVVVLGAVYAYELTDYLLEQARLRDHCTSFYVRCVEAKPHLPCNFLQSVLYGTRRVELRGLSEYLG